MSLQDNKYKKGVEAGQDLLDLSIQAYGSIDMLFVVANDNPSIVSLTDLPAPASLFNYRLNTPVAKPQVRKWLNEQNIEVNTHNQALEDNLLLQEDYNVILQELSTSGILITNNNILNAQSSYNWSSISNNPTA